MLGRILFAVSVSAAILVVLLLALISPPKSHSRPPWIPLDFRFHPIPRPQNSSKRALNPNGSGGNAVIFRHSLTEGARNSPRVVGTVVGFVSSRIKNEAFDGFRNMIYLRIDEPERAGSLSLEMKQSGRLIVAGGTGFFAFARGFGISARTGCWVCSAEPDGSFYINLRVRVLK